MTWGEGEYVTWCSRRAHVADRIFCDKPQALARQIAASGIADEHVAPVCAATVEEGEHGDGDLRCIEHVTAEDEVYGRRDISGDIERYRHQPYPIRLGVDLECVAAIGIGFGSEDFRRARPHGGDADEAGTGAEIEHTLAGDHFGVVEHMPRQRQAAAPDESPIGRRRIAIGIELRQTGAGMGEVKADLGDRRQRREPKMAANEGGVGDTGQDAASSSSATSPRSNVSTVRSRSRRGTKLTSAKSGRASTFSTTGVGLTEGHKPAT